MPQAPAHSEIVEKAAAKAVQADEKRGDDKDLLEACIICKYI